MLFKGNIFENVDLTYYHLKPEIIPQTWYVNEKLLEFYISLER